ncbi:MAG: carbohydrate kinase [Devosiaceae bacterium]|nr:carbohydrate kinase [Devosiaceae bacterium MH13]
MSTAVIDIGKTNAKVVLIGSDGDELWERRLPNTVVEAPPYPHFDSDRLWAFVLDALADLPEQTDCIVPVTHGACAALVDADGDLVLPVLDYEHAGPDQATSSYAAPPFAQTGSPPLPGGLNVGRQLYWLETNWPEAFGRTAHILMWPQWWSFRLTGIAASEVTSLGCHTDLWVPADGVPSLLADARGWSPLLPPLRRADAVLGPLKAELALATGLPEDLPVLTGIHDSNASLLPYLQMAPCGVLSTGTWIIAMSLNDAAPALDPEDDMLLNVAANGRPVPTARFMGGRERDEALARGTPLDVADRGAAERAAERLAALAASGPVYVEGPFAQSAVFMETLAARTGRPVHGREGSGTTAGASLLARAISGKAAF